VTKHQILEDDVRQHRRRRRQVLAFRGDGGGGLSRERLKKRNTNRVDGDVSDVAILHNSSNVLTVHPKKRAKWMQKSKTI